MGLMALPNREARILFSKYHSYNTTNFDSWGFSDESKFKMSDIHPKYKWANNLVNPDEMEIEVDFRNLTLDDYNQKMEDLKIKRGRKKKTE